MKIFIITNIPAPYRLPLFAMLDREFKNNGWTLQVIFLTRSYERRKWQVNENEFQFHYHFLDLPHLNFRESFFSFGFSIYRYLYAEKPDILIIGGFSLPMLNALLYARCYNIPICLWSGETIQQSHQRKDFLNLRKILRRWIIRQAAGAAVYGEAAKAYLIKMGMPEKNIFITINTVDTKFFDDKVSDLRTKKEEIKKTFGYPLLNLLYVGHLTEPKGLQYVFQAIKEIEDFDTNAALHIVGSGPYEPELKKLKNNLKLQNIYFHGFKQKEDLPFYYAIADIFVFPSLYDVWGLVCIEAMISKLALICSREAGIAQNLKDQSDVWLIDPKDPVGLSHAIRELLFNPGRRNNLSHNAYTFAKTRMQLSNAVQGFCDLVKHLL